MVDFDGNLNQQKRMEPFAMKYGIGWRLFAVTSKMTIVDNETEKKVEIFVEIMVVAILRAYVMLP